MKFSYVLPDPASYRAFAEFEAELASVRETGYDAVELQIEAPATFAEKRVLTAIDAAGLTLCAFQTGATYATCGNCLSTPNAAVRERTEALMRSFVDLAGKWQAVMVVGSLQGRLRDEPSKATGESRIRDAMRRIGEYALSKNATIAFEPVNHGEVGFHNTIEAASAMVRGIGVPSLRLMIDTFHMNIEEKDMVSPIHGVRDILAHVHLSETSRDVLGTGHMDTQRFLVELRRIEYQGFCSVGVYNTQLSTRTCMAMCMKALQDD